MFKTARIPLFGVLLSVCWVCGAWAKDWEVKVPPNSPDARYGHTMVTLPDGRVMLFGGLDDGAVVRNDLYVYANNDWTEETPANTPPPARVAHAAWVRDGKMYVHGGYDAQHQALDDLWYYDPQSKQWTEIPTTGGPTPRRAHSATVLADGSVLIFGGRDVDHNQLGDLWKLKTDNTWEQLASYSPSSQHTAQLVGDSLYVFPYPYWGWIYVYNVATNKWSELDGGPSLNGYATSAVGQNAQGQDVIYVFGGLDRQAKESDVVYEYNVETRELIERPERMPYPLYFSASTGLPDGTEIFFGGRSNKTPINTTLLFSSEEAPPLSTNPSRTNNSGSDVGDPVTANDGAYYFTLGLLDLGGVFPLRYELRYRMDQWSGVGLINGFDSNVNPTLAWGIGITGAPALEISLKNGDTLNYVQNAGNWELDGVLPTRYVIKETGPDNSHGYYYLMDPVREKLYIFEKVTGLGNPDWCPARPLWVMDRNNNRHTYTYTGDNLFPDRIEDGLGRSLNFTYDPAVYYWAVLVTVTDQTGRHVDITYEQNAPDYDDQTVLRSVTDSGGSTTTFHYTYIPSLYTGAISAVDRPLGNTPYSQAVADITLNGRNDWPRVTSQSDAYGNTTTLSYEAAFNQVTETRADGNSVVYEHYHNDGVQKSITDPTGEVIRFNQTSHEQIASVIDRLGDTTSFTYHPETGKLASITNAKGETLTYTYTPQVQTFTNPANAETVDFTFYNLTRIDYPDGTSKQFTYDNHGNAITYTDPAGRSWQYEHNARGQVTRITNPTGGAVDYTCNADATLASRTDSDVGLISYGYDAYKRLSTITRPGGSTVRFTRDDNDRLLTVTDELGNTTAFTYDDNGNLLTATDRLGETVTYARDLMDRIESLTDPLGYASAYAYDKMGRLETFIDRNGNTTIFTYDARGWLSDVTDPAGQAWTYAYDDEGVLAALTTPMGLTTALQTDKLGRLIGVTDPLGEQTDFSYDALGRITAVNDRLSRLTSYTYDAAGWLNSVTKPVIGTAAYTRNGLGLLTRITDLRGRPWDFGYSPMGRLTSETDPLGRQWIYAHDERGRLSQITYPSGSDIAAITYDNVSRVSQIAYSGGPTLNYTYDAAGRLLTVIDSSAGLTASLALTYDARGDVTDSRDAAASFGATYDNGRRLKTVAYDGQAAVTYIYDERDLLTRVEDDLSGTWMSFTYDADGRMTEITRSNGVSTAYTYDAAGRVIGIQDGTLANQQYTLNAEGEPTQAVMDVPLAGGTITYTYDDAGRLIEVDYGNANRLAYAYDNAGNLLSRTGSTPLDPAAGTEMLTYDDASQISSPGYVCDNRGRLTNSPGNAYTWDGASRLTGIDGVTLTYNGLGDLLTHTEAGNIVHYYYNYAIGLNPIVAEKDEGTGQFLRYYVWTPGGRLLYMIDATSGNKVYFYHFDRVGSTLALTDAAGTVTDSYVYTPYGRLLQHNGASEQPFTFVGQWGVRQEGDSGELYHMRARYYDAVAARFVSRDPVWPQIGDPREINPYQYAKENPLSYIDPWGTAPYGTAEYWEDQARYYEERAQINEEDADFGAWLGGTYDWHKKTAEEYRKEAKAARKKAEAERKRERERAAEAARKAREADIQAAQRGLFYFQCPLPQTQAFVGNRQAPQKANQTAEDSWYSLFYVLSEEEKLKYGITCKEDLDLCIAYHGGGSHWNYYFSEP